MFEEIASSATWRVDTADHMAKALTPIKTANKPADEAFAKALLVQIAWAVAYTEPETERMFALGGEFVFMYAGMGIVRRFTTFRGGT